MSSLERVWVVESVVVQETRVVCCGLLWFFTVCWFYSYCNLHLYQRITSTTYYTIMCIKILNHHVYHNKLTSQQARLLSAIQNHHQKLHSP